MPEGYRADTWEAAEENAARLLREWGWRDAKRTPPGPDGGLDVVGAGVVAQVKWRASATGAPTLRDFYGAAHTTPGAMKVFFASAAFTSAALDFANATGIALFTYDITGSATPVNSAARRIVERPPVRSRAKKALGGVLRGVPGKVTEWADRRHEATIRRLDDAVPPPPKPASPRPEPTRAMKDAQQFIDQARAAAEAAKRRRP